MPIPFKFSPRRLKVHLARFSIVRSLSKSKDPPVTSTNGTDMATTDTPEAAVAKPQPTAQSSTVTTSLETLPFEIKRLILSQAPTLDTLRALVHASPQLHSVYAQDRLRILRAFVEQSLDGMLFDAHAAYLSGTDLFQQTRDEPMLWDFLHDFQNRRTTVAPSDLAAQLALEDLIQLARFHHFVIEPLTERYSIWALAALSSSPQDCPLSGTERRRIQRALYRYQIYCNLCGSRGEGRSSPRCIQDPLQSLRILSLFPAWQIEEILCIHKFGKDTYGGVFDRVAWDLDEERNPRYRDVDLWSVRENLQLFSEPPVYYINRESRESMLRHGLPVLSLVFKITDHDILVEFVREHILSVERHSGGRYSSWIGEAVSDLNQELRRQRWYSEHDAAQDRRDKTPFDKDTLDQPPLAWVTFWDGEASNYFGPYVRRTFRRWGFVMWDAPRLRASGALEYMEFEAGWPGGDPREDFFTDLDDMHAGIAAV